MKNENTIQQRPHQQFIRKPKRKSPKHKKQLLYHFKHQHKQNHHNTQKEEYNNYNNINNQSNYYNDTNQSVNCNLTQSHLQQNTPHLKQSHLVLDLKHQLSFLKQQMAKIVHSKIQSLQNNQIKIIDYYFPSNNQPNYQQNLNNKDLKQSNLQNTQSNKSKIDITINSKHSHIVKTQQTQKQSQNSVKKLKSKQRLKFSKIKKNQKLSQKISSQKTSQGSLSKIQSISPFNKKSSKQPHSSTQIQSIQNICINSKQQLDKKTNQKNNQQKNNQQKNKKRTKSTQQSLIQDDIKKLSQKHKKKLQYQINQSVLDQQNINNNVSKIQMTNKQKSKQNTTPSSNPSSKSGMLSRGSNISQSYEVKIRRLKKQIRQQQLKIKEQQDEILIKQVKLKQSQQITSRLNEKVSLIQQQLSLKHAQLYQLNHSNKQLQAQLSYHKQKQLEYKRLQQQYECLRQKMEEIVFIKHQIQNKYVKLNQQFGKISDGNIKLQEKYHKQMQCNKKLTRQNTKLTQQITNLNQHHKFFKQQTKKIKQQNQTTLQSFNILQHKLKNKQLQTIKLQKINLNLSSQINQIKTCYYNVIELVNKLYWRQSLSNSQNSQICKIVEQWKNKQSKKESISYKQTQVSHNNCLLHKSPINNISLSTNVSQLSIPTLSTKHLSPQQPHLSIISPTLSPRTQSTLKQKQLISIIKVHQKSILNYQKDLNFLQSQCKNLHHYKLLNKKQQQIIKSTNQLLINQHINKLNCKYQLQYNKWHENSIDKHQNTINKQQNPKIQQNTKHESTYKYQPKGIQFGNNLKQKPKDTTKKTTLKSQGSIIHQTIKNNTFNKQQ